jgi:hypothetical protein
MRCFVGYLFLLDTANTGINMYMMYKPLIILFGSPEAVKFFPPLFLTEPALIVSHLCHLEVVISRCRPGVYINTNPSLLRLENMENHEVRLDSRHNLPDGSHFVCWRSVDDRDGRYCKTVLAQERAGKHPIFGACQFLRQWIDFVL